MLGLKSRASIVRALFGVLGALLKSTHERPSRPEKRVRAMGVAAR